MKLINPDGFLIGSPRTLVFTATYNELDNIQLLLDEIWNDLVLPLLPEIEHIAHYRRGCSFCFLKCHGRCRFNITYTTVDC